MTMWKATATAYDRDDSVLHVASVIARDERWAVFLATEEVQDSTASSEAWFRIGIEVEAV